jgi:hypothetical protein
MSPTLAAGDMSMRLARTAVAAALLFLLLDGCETFTFPEKSTLSSASEIRVTHYIWSPEANTQETRVIARVAVPKVVRLFGSKPCPYETLGMEEYQLEFRSDSGATLGVVDIVDFEWYLESPRRGSFYATNELVAYLDSFFAAPKSAK